MPRALATTLLLLVGALPCVVAPRAAVAQAPDVSARAPARQDAAPGGATADERIAEIRRRIQEALVYPPLARKRRITGATELSFRIGPGGGAEEIEVLRSSGSALLDRAAARAVEDAAPLPAVLGRLVLPVAFELSPR